MTTAADKAGPREGARRRLLGPAAAAAVIALIVVGCLLAPGGAPAFGQAFLDGLRLGMILALIGVGLSLVYSTTGIFNFAHGELATLGAVLAWWFNAVLGLPLVLAAVIAILLAAALSYGSERVLWRPLRRRRVNVTSVLVVAIGLGLGARSVFLFLMGGGRQSYTEFAIQKPVTFLGVSATPKDLLSIALCALALAALGLFLRKAKLGQAIRAVSDDPVLAGASGIAVNRSISLVWAIAGALAALGGVLLGLSEQITWDMGNLLLLLVIAGVTLGGLGTVYGALAGSVVVGVATQLSTLWIPAELKFVTALVLLIVILLLRPQGILGKGRRVA